MFIPEGQRTSKPGLLPYWVEESSEDKNQAQEKQEVTSRLFSQSNFSHPDLKMLAYAQRKFLLCVWTQVSFYVFQAVF